MPRARAEVFPLTLSVVDTGPGIEPEMMPRLFGRFEQGDTSSKRRYGGAGLGLAISDRIVQQLGGRIEVESEIGQGATFRVHLRLPATSDSALSAKMAPVRSLEGLRVLVVDDDEVNRLIAEGLLKHVGASPTSCADGAEAVALAQDGFHVILMDCHMPGVDGFEATRTIRARGSDIPILALTASVTREDQERCFEAGMNACLAKPLTEEQLVTRVARELRRYEGYALESGEG